VNATPIELIKTGSVQVPPLGTVDFTDNFFGTNLKSARISHRSRLITHECGVN
jgi:hypothetical protein